MRIKCAAIRFEGKIYEGPAHCTIGHEMLAQGVCSRPYPCGEAQGFVTECGKFVSRKAAMMIAIAAGQVVQGKTCCKHELYSEDLRGVKGSESK